VGTAVSDGDLILARVKHDAGWSVVGPDQLELQAARAVVDAAREFLDELDSDSGWRYPLERADRLAKLIDIAKAKRP
jgi:hypothetical protein